MPNHASHPSPLELIQKHGRSSASFMTLYPGFKYFVSKDPSLLGIIAYVETAHTWIGGAEPFTAKDQQFRLLTEFAEAASIAGKTAVLLPVDTELAKIAASVGYETLQIGCEPTFELENYPPTPPVPPIEDTWLNIIPAANHLNSTGAQVCELHPQQYIEGQYSEHLRWELDQLIQESLSSRQIEPLGFLNQVNPWQHAKYKRFFYLQQGEKILAFTSTVPIWARKSWYIIDTMLAKNAPPGSAELLILQVMRILREEGANEISFGMAPLADLPKDLDRHSKHASLNRLLNFMFHRGHFFHPLRSLYRYKLRYRPNRFDPVYLIYKPLPGKHALRPKVIIEIFQVFLPRGIIWSMIMNLIRTIQHFPLFDSLKALFRNTMLTSSRHTSPENLKNLLSRCKFTFLVALTNIVIFLLTTQSSTPNFLWKLDHAIETRWGFSWDNWTHSPFRTLALFHFFHWNIQHLILNTLMLILLTGLLECFAGTLFTVTCFLIPMILSNPITFWILTRAGIDISNQFDIGISLGVFGTIGALATLLNHGSFLLIGLSSGIALEAFTVQRWIDLSHLTAMILGIIVSYLLRRRTL